MDQVQSQTGEMGGAVRRGLSWNLVNFFVTQVLSLLIMIVLANRLEPSVFGVYAIAALLVDIFLIQGKSAVMDTLIQRQNLSQARMSTIFWAAMAVCLVVIAVFVMAAPVVAVWIEAPELAYALPALALTLIGMPSMALLDGQLTARTDFKSMTIRNMVAVVVGGAVGLAFAFSALAEWALVAQRAANIVCSVALLTLRTRWLPSLVWNEAHATDFVRGVAPIFFSQVFTVLGQRSTDAFIAAALGVRELGIVRVLARFVESLDQAVPGALLNLWVPLLSRAANDAAARRQFFLEMMRIAALLCVPVYLGLAIVAEDLTHILFKDAYDPGIVVLIAMAVAGLHIPFSFYRLPILTALGHGKLMWALTALDIAVTIGTLAVFIGEGLPGVAKAVLARIVIGHPIFWAVLLRVAGVKPMEFLRAITPAFAAAMAMTIVALAAQVWLAGAPLLAQLIGVALLGAISYGGWLLAFHRDWLRRVLMFLSQRG